MDYVTKKRIEALKKERSALKSMRTALLIGETVKFSEEQIAGRLQTIREQLDNLTPRRLKTETIDNVTTLSVKAEARVKYTSIYRKTYHDLSLSTYKKCVQRKMTLEQIAKRMCVGSGTLLRARRKWVKEGLLQEEIKARTLTLTLECYKECVARGMTVKEIAEFCGVTTSSVYNKRRRWCDKGLLDNELVSS